MAGKTPKKVRSKFFRVAVEGATSDGRTIERAQIEEMAQSYDPQLYGARIWVEHLRSLLPESPFRAYGDVLALKAEEVEIGGERKLALFARIEPTGDLVNMVNVLKQKLFTSIEIAPKFADTGKAYLQGLAVTDTPASLGTEMLAFAAQHPDHNPLKERKQAPENLFTAAAETHIEFESVAPAPARSTRFATFLSGLGLGRPSAPEPASAPEPDAQLSQFCDFIAAQMSEQDAEMDALREQLARSRADMQGLSNRLATLSQQLERTPDGAPLRPLVAGPSGGDATDC